MIQCRVMVESVYARTLSTFLWNAVKVDDISSANKTAPFASKRGSETCFTGATFVFDVSTLHVGNCSENSQ